MARLPRIYVKGCSYHIVQRGNNREPCFYTEQDYATYLTYLKESADSCYVAIHAYVLMTNHVHMLVTPMDDGDISRMVQSLGRKYVRYFNSAHQREVGRRKSRQPVLLVINVELANLNGSIFYQGNDMVVLAGHIPVAAIQLFGGL